MNSKGSKLTVDKTGKVIPTWDLNEPTNIASDNYYSSVDYNIINFDKQLKPESQYPTQYQEDYGKNTKKYSNQEQQIQAIDALNQLRTAPQSFIPYLQMMRNQFKGNLYTDPKTGIQQETEEGVDAIDNCIHFLKNQQPVPPVTHSLGLQFASEDHADDIGGKGLTSNNGSNGSTLKDRMTKFGSFKGKVGQLQSYGFTDGLDLIKQLVIDDGDSSRKTRKQLFDTGMNKVGIGVADHNDYDQCGVLKYAQEYQDKPDIAAMRKPRNQSQYYDDANGLAQQSQQNQLKQQELLQKELELERQRKLQQQLDEAERRQRQDDLRRKQELLDKELQLKQDELNRKQREAEQKRLQDAQDDEYRRKQLQMQLKLADLDQQNREQEYKLKQKELDLIRHKELRLEEELRRKQFEEERKIKEKEKQKKQELLDREYKMKQMEIQYREEQIKSQQGELSEECHLTEYRHNFTSPEYKRNEIEYDLSKPDNALSTTISKHWEQGINDKELVVDKKYLLKNGKVKTLTEKVDQKSKSSQLI